MKYKELSKVISPIGDTMAHRAVFFRTLPSDFEDWELADYKGRTVAHKYLKRMGRLPESFTQWDLADNQGLTVAHEAALLGLLPKDFDRWELATHSGVTVAFFAALSGTLPVTFDKWELLGENAEDFKERYLSAKKRH